MHGKRNIEAILFDFGGVIAEEGFREGLLAIAAAHGIDPDRFFADAEEVIVETGYLTGRGDESSFWTALRTRHRIGGTDHELRREILSRFIIRDEVLSVVDGLRSKGFVVAVLSDQTNWLEEIDATSRFFSHFDAVFNSYRIGKSKRDPSVFSDVCASLRVERRRALFIDDNPGHVGRARAAGLRAILFTSTDSFRRELEDALGAAS